MTLGYKIEWIDILREIKFSKIKKKIFFVTDCPMPDQVIVNDKVWSDCESCCLFLTFYHVVF